MDAVSRQRVTGGKFFLTPGNLHTPGHHLIMLGNILIEVPSCPRICNPRLGWLANGRRTNFQERPDIPS